MQATVTVYFAKARDGRGRSRGPKVQGFSKRFWPGQNKIPASYWEALIGEATDLKPSEERQCKAFREKYIATGKLRALDGPPPAPSVSLKPGLNPDRLNAFSIEDCKALIGRCNDLEQIANWGRSEEREAVKDLLIKRYHVLSQR